MATLVDAVNKEIWLGDGNHSCDTFSMTLGDRIKKRLAASGLTQAALAAAIGVSPQAVSKLINGETAETTKLYKIARFLKTTPEYLLGETSDPAPLKSNVRLLDNNDPDLVELPEIDLRYGMGAAYIDFPVGGELRRFSRAWLRNFTTAAPEELFWATGDGDSMEPTIRSGETILIDTSQTVPRMNEGIWALAIGDVGMIKRLHFAGRDRIELRGDNGVIPPIPVIMEELHIIGRVVAVVRKL